MSQVTSSAPGRLDVMGGVADYSGSLVLEMPIRALTNVSVSQIQLPEFRLTSSTYGNWSILADDFLDTKDEIDARRWLIERQAPSWVFYVLGSLWVLCRAKGLQLKTGLSFRVKSRVPEGMGVSSSAALEVATTRALCRLMGVLNRGKELAHLCQRAENRIVGAPCGLMDQLTVEHGKPGSLLPILCRPDILRHPIVLPHGVVIVGWASGVKHAVSASPYTTARTATFMGKRIFEKKVGCQWSHASEISPSIFDRYARHVLPESISGQWFSKRYGRTSDSLSRVHKSSDYKVRSSLQFPIRENFRVELAEFLLRTNEGRLEQRLCHVGELMLQSHEGYTSLGLGSPETDQMVKALVSLGAEKGIYGARASGGGSGGTVVVLARKAALPELTALVKQVRFNETPTTLIR